MRLRPASLFLLTLIAAFPSVANDKPCRDGTMQHPKVLTRAEPVYTPEAKGARIGGKIILEALIGVDGAVHRVGILKDVGYGLGGSAKAAVEKWTFDPTRCDGVVVPVQYNITINFIAPPPDEKQD